MSVLTQSSDSTNKRYLDMTILLIALVKLETNQTRKYISVHTILIIINNRMQTIQTNNDNSKQYSHTKLQQVSAEKERQE